MSCCRFSRSFPLFSIFYSSLVSCLIVVLLPPGDRRQSCRLICGSPSDLPLYRFFLRTSDCLLCGQDQLNHIPRIPPQSLLPVSQLGVFWTSYLIFQKILTIGTINRGVPCPTQLFFFFSSCQPPTPKHNGVATTTRAIEAACLLSKKLLGWI